MTNKETLQAMIDTYDEIRRISPDTIPSLRISYTEKISIEEGIKALGFVERVLKIVTPSENNYIREFPEYVEEDLYNALEEFGYYKGSE